MLESIKNLFQACGVKLKGTFNWLSKKNPDNMNEQNDNIIEFRRRGRISGIHLGYAIIDEDIVFEVNSFPDFRGDCKVNRWVEYVGCFEKNSERIYVKEIVRVLSPIWNGEDVTDALIRDELESLQQKKPDYFTSFDRNIYGIITERKQDSICIDASERTFEIYLDEAIIDFVPLERDRVRLRCNVQVKIDGGVQKEIIEVATIHAANMKIQAKCIVKELYEDWGALNDDGYFCFSTVSGAVHLRIGDEIVGDFISCDKGKYLWRCIQLTFSKTT